MKRKLERLAFAVVLSLAGVQIAAAQAPPAPKPGPEHQRLGYFVGKWTTEGTMQPGPMGPGGKMTSTDTCEWFEGHFAVVCHSEGKSAMGASKEIALMSYSPEEKAYTYYSTNNSGMTMTSVPKGTVTGDTWTYNDEMAMAGQKMKMRVTLKEVSPTAYTFKMEMQGPDGKWIPTMEAKSTKAK
jgi:hypothetical protein